MKFIIDTQLPPALAKFLTEKGFDAMHTTFFADGHLLQDDEIIHIAVDENRIITTKDSDFLDNYLLRGSPPKVLLLQFGNINNKELLQCFENHLHKIISVFEDGAELVKFNKESIVVY
jgi:predicted nuclease of predicted toxin-antitoxin system